MQATNAAHCFEPHPFSQRPVSNLGRQGGISPGIATFATVPYFTSKGVFSPHGCLVQRIGRLLDVHVGMLPEDTVPVEEFAVNCGVTVELYAPPNDQFMVFTGTYTALLSPGMYSSVVTNEYIAL